MSPKTRVTAPREGRGVQVVSARAQPARARAVGPSSFPVQRAAHPRSSDVLPVIAYHLQQAVREVDDLRQTKQKESKLKQHVKISVMGWAPQMSDRAARNFLTC